MYHYLCKVYWWSRMMRDIENFMARCTKFQLAKVKN